MLRGESKAVPLRLRSELLVLVKSASAEPGDVTILAVAVAPADRADANDRV